MVAEGGGGTTTPVPFPARCPSARDRHPPSGREGGRSLDGRRERRRAAAGSAPGAARPRPDVRAPCLPPGAPGVSSRSAVRGANGPRSDPRPPLRPAAPAAWRRPDWEEEPRRGRAARRLCCALRLSVPRRAGPVLSLAAVLNRRLVRSREGEPGGRRPAGGQNRAVRNSGAAEGKQKQGWMLNSSGCA